MQSSNKCPKEIQGKIAKHVNGSSKPAINVRRKIIIILWIFIFLVGAVTIFNILYNKQYVEIDKQESFFSDFSIIKNNVDINCYITIKSTYSKDIKVKLTANMEDDFNSGLLKKAELLGINKANGEKLFQIPAKTTKSFDVVFSGEFGGNDKKINRLLPNIVVEIIN